MKRFAIGMISIERPDGITKLIGYNHVFKRPLHRCMAKIVNTKEDEQVCCEMERRKQIHSQQIYLNELVDVDRTAEKKENNRQTEEYNESITTAYSSSTSEKFFNQGNMAEWVRSNERVYSTTIYRYMLMYATIYGRNQSNKNLTSFFVLISHSRLAYSFTI